MQRTKRHRNRLLITLVLFTLVAASAWVTSPADARGALGSGASSHLGVTRPGATITSGDPDAGQGSSPTPPAVKVKQCRPLPGREAAPAFFDWVRWTSSIRATFWPRAAN